MALKESVDQGLPERGDLGHWRDLGQKLQHIFKNELLGLG